ncbi:MAG: molybdopterin oxidoreductase family protein [Alphaproteobacteria bacterium]|nr:molybdopterin oxidoreductase family protein [Alphaproteobacteria bacterium]
MHASVCPHDCPSVCAIEVEKLDERTIGRVNGAEANSYTAGVVCAKVARYAERIHHPERLLHPLRRIGAKGDGRHERISWDAALDEIADRFTRAAQKHGSETVWPYFFAGTMGLVQRDGINRLRHAMKYSGMDKTICTWIVQAGWLAGTGKQWGVDPREIAGSDLVIMWGGNPVATQVNLMAHVSRARKERGAKFIVIDPYRTPTAQVADQHIMLRPGTDGALACAVMHVMFKEGFADRDYLARYTDDPVGLEAHLATRTPEWAAAITGLAVEEILGFAREYGRVERAYLRVGYGFSRSRNGAANVHAVSCLPAVGGKWKHRGGGAFWNFGHTYRWDKTMIEGLDRRDPKIRVFDMSRLGAILTGDPTDLRGGPPVTAMLIQNVNPMNVCPDLNKVRRGFLREDLFVAVHEQFMTDTAAIADIVLPATMFLEHDDIYQAGGHSHIQIGRKIVEAPGDCRTNHFVICELAKRLGAEHPGFHLTELEIIDWTLAKSGWPDAATITAERWHDAVPDFETAHFLNGFGFPDGKFRFRPDWKSLGPYGERMPEWPDFHAIIEAATPEHPFRLLAPPARNFLNTSFTETPGSRKREGKPSVMIHPADAVELGIAAGDMVTLGNHRGTVALEAKLFDGVQRKVIVVESIWPNAHFPGGLGINAVIGDEPAPPNGGAAFHDTHVWVRRSGG